MKSAYDLAMEKFGHEPVKQLTAEQKEAIAEIDRKYQAKIAEAEVMHQGKLKKVGADIEAIEQLRNDLTVEIASYREKSEREKEKIRGGDENS